MIYCTYDILANIGVITHISFYSGAIARPDTVPRFTQEFILNEGTEMEYRKCKCDSIMIENLKSELYNFFMWFRENGEKYIDGSIENMIEIYMDEQERT